MTKKAETPKGHSVQEFREKHDKSYYVPRRIKEALQRLGTNFMYELEFAKEANVSTHDLANYREEFEDHIVMAAQSGRREAKRCWFGDKRTAAKMREAQ